MNYVDENIVNQQNINKKKEETEDFLEKRIFDICQNEKTNWGISRKKKNIKSLNELIVYYLDDRNDGKKEYKPCEKARKNNHVKVTNQRNEKLKEKKEPKRRILSYVDDSEPEQPQDESTKEVKKEPSKESKIYKQIVTELGDMYNWKKEEEDEDTKKQKEESTIIPIEINKEFKETLEFCRNDVDEDCFHLRKIQNKINKIHRKLKFYKHDQHDIHKFRPREKKELSGNSLWDQDHYFLISDKNKYEEQEKEEEEDNLDVSKENTLHHIQRESKHIVNYLRMSDDSVKLNDIIHILDLITCPDFDKRSNKYKYLKMFIKQYYHMYPFEHIGGLRKIRKYVKENFAKNVCIRINEHAISSMYLTTNIKRIISNDDIIKNIINIHIDNGKFWIQLLHNIWIPLMIEKLNSSQCSFYSYLANYNNDVAILDQFTYSKTDFKFYQLSSFIFTGILYCGIPSVYRLLMRLYAYKYIEHRINILLERNSEHIYNETVASALTYNIDAIRNMFPFFKEFKNINIENISLSFFKSSFFEIVLSSLRKEKIEKKKNISQKFLNFINTFLLMCTEFLYGVSCKEIIKKINEREIKLWDLLETVFYDHMNILIARDVLLFIVDLLCLHKLNSIPIKKRFCYNVLEYSELVKNMYYQKNDLVHQESWKQVYVIAVKIYHFANSSLQKKQTIEDNVVLQELSLINRFYMSYLKQDNSIGEFYFLKNTNYGIYCWNSICTNHLNIHNMEDNRHNFEYCQGCNIAIYCSEECRIIHLIASHHNVCVYFKSIPSFLKFNTLNDDFVHSDLKFMNLFENIDIYDKQNELYHILY